MLPRMATVINADELKVMLPLTPTRGLGEFVGSYTGCKAVVEFSNVKDKEPFTPSRGAKKATAPLFPAGQATNKRGPMMVRLLSC